MNRNVVRWIPRIIFIAVVAAVVAFLVIKKPWSKGDDSITFSTVPVGKGSIAAQVTAAGTLSAKITVQVGAQVSGIVKELHADFNSQVKKGQVIAKLDDVLLKAQVDQMQAAFDSAIANEKKAEVAEKDGIRQYNREKGLQDQQLIAAQTVEGFEVTRDEAITALAAAKAAVGQAYANLVQAKANLGYAVIYSPIDGVVLTRSYDIGQTVQSSFSAPTLFTIAADLSYMQIDTAVAEADVGRLADGMKATFTVDAFPSRVFEGTVRQVRNSPTTTSGVVTYDAVIDVANQDHVLRPGMTANCTFVLEKVDDTIKIPNAALRFKPSREQIMALFEKFGGGMRGGSGAHHHGSGGSGAGSGGWRGMGGDSPGGTGAFGMGQSGKGASDRKVVWKLVDGKPKMTFVKLGLTDGSSTQLLEGDVQTGDQLITEVQGLPTGGIRKMGAF
ncbi:MAG TPA: efflux RND transporter periplasmic adaptor subunit [Kofleriaceae bacterium]|nr:efflux RND transporter periplasmic adaptor subunit [Kofleriaceae bacterium]